MITTKIPKQVQTIAIDSLKLRIPLSKVEVVNDDLISYYADLNLTTGEVDEVTTKRKALLIAEKGIKTRYLIEVKRGAVTCEYLAILCNSKLLKTRYLDGIQRKTVRLLYSSLMSQNVVKIKYEDFLNAQISDTDVKFDVVIPCNDVRESLFEILKSMTKLSQVKRGGVDFKKQSGNRGVQWGKRDVANISHPHIKIYAKDLEMINNNKGEHCTVVFCKSFEIKPKVGLTRLEGTIKNEKHFWSFFDDKRFTLKNIIETPQKDLYKLLLLMLQRHLDMNFKIKNMKKKKEKKKLNYKDVMTIVALELLVENAELKNKPMTPLLALEHITSAWVDCKFLKNKIKNKISELWYEFIQTPEETEKAIEWSKKTLGKADKKAKTEMIDSYLQLFTGLNADIENL